MPDPTPLYQDATAVLTCRELDALPDARPGIVVCQISHASNLDFLLPAPRLHSPSALPPIGPAVLTSTSMASELRAPHIRSGRVLPPSLTPSVLCRLLEVPQLAELLELMLLGGLTGNDAGTADGCLLQWAVPTPFVAATYAQLLSHLVQDCHAVPLGLHRRSDAANAAGEHQQYVVAAPPAGLLLRADDCVFVLGAES